MSSDLALAPELPVASGTAFDGAFGSILREAAARGASDVHLEPLIAGLRIRMRVHGELRTVRSYTDSRRAARLMEVVKRSCGFDLGRRGEPQDARFATVDPPFDYRAALVPLLEGESIVLRLLERERDFDLASYSLHPDAKLDLRRALSKRDGLIVVSGPTGSGKSTLLYNALGSLDREALKVATIEDPVEYRLEGICQSPVNGRDERMSFSSILRAFMRADPDVILVGEIRDRETAEATLHAASTGHLVLTTVHANSTVEIADRLEGLGVSRALYEANLRFASAQRLVPRLCPHCRIIDAEGAQLLHDHFALLQPSLHSLGCSDCSGTGVSGRVLLFEWQCRAPGSTELVASPTLLDDALRRVKEGEIDVRTACSL